MEFITVKDYPEIEISKCGIIRRKKNNSIKSQYLNDAGYYMITLSRNNKSNPLRVHRLLAKTFIPNPKNYATVNHIDGVKTNNSLSNLEWLSHKENVRHAFRIGLVNNTGENNGKSVLTKQQVLEIKKMKGKLSQQKIAELFPVSRSTIQGIFNGRLWQNVK